MIAKVSYVTKKASSLFLSYRTNLIIVAGQFCNLNVNTLKHHLCSTRVIVVTQTPALAAGCLRDKPAP